MIFAVHGEEKLDRETGGRYPELNSIPNNPGWHQCWKCMNKSFNTSQF